MQLCRNLKLKLAKVAKLDRFAENVTIHMQARATDSVVKW